MRRAILILLAVIITVLLGYIFSLSSAFNNTRAASTLSSGWKSPAPCAKANNGCIEQNLCIAPVPAPQKGMPFRYKRANAATCSVQTNPTAEALDWVAYAIVAILIAFGASRVYKSEKDWKV